LYEKHRLTISECAKYLYRSNEENSTKLEFSPGQTQSTARIQIAHFKILKLIRYYWCIGMYVCINLHIFIAHINWIWAFWCPSHEVNAHQPRGSQVLSQ